MRERRNTGGTDLRGMLLASTPSLYGLAPSADLPRVWAGLMEIALGEDAKDSASVVAIADGSASLYTSRLGGVIGAGEHESVRRSALEFLRAMDGSLDVLGLAASAPRPSRRGEYAFVALTYQGMRRATVDEASAATRGHALFPLFVAGHALLTAIRTTTEQTQRGDRQ
ncbi:MAG TPA: hypothetical protein VFM06_01480 [Candidatus Limnocylindria bacterium]|nr:hypothetical protein [Candidatus Limnocylindria bacterium]